MFIVAPALSFDFQQDYIVMSGVRYYALRIPYSIINELHQNDFSALKQPVDEMQVNDTVDAVGFDFVRRPELKYEAGIKKTKKGDEGYLKVVTFKSEATVRDSSKKWANRETLSMVMLDFDFDTKSDIFAFDAIFYSEDLEAAGWTLRFPTAPVGQNVMAIFIDIYGNDHCSYKSYCGR